MNSSAGNLECTGLVISARPIKEYDRRIVILTRERGKISCFANGARRPGSSLQALDTFAFGTFRLYEGRSSYTLKEAQVSHYFEGLRTDVEAALYGSYFMEVLDYVTRENNPDTGLLLLGYYSLRALEHKKIPNRLVRAIFEIRLVTEEGEYAGPASGRTYEEGTRFALGHITGVPCSKLFTFAVSDQVLAELEEEGRRVMKERIRHSFSSLEVLSALLG